MIRSIVSACMVTAVLVGCGGAADDASETGDVASKSGESATTEATGVAEESLSMSAPSGSTTATSSGPASTQMMHGEACGACSNATATQTCCVLVPVYVAGRIVMTPSCYVVNCLNIGTGATITTTNATISTKFP
ncbi:MAG TPA: hypothetical protein VH062_11555 [Polyangiaceae bacterium]|jgi:hypothetical protein|nr:hypothetical protein [Polyangiaceae bacterium]